MKAILAACVLAIAACGGSTAAPPRVSGHWTLFISPGRTADLSMATDDSNNPLANAAGTLIVDGQTIALVGSADVNSGSMIGTLDATRSIEIDMAFVRTGVSGEYCEKQRRAGEPQITDSACAEFFGLPL